VPMTTSRRAARRVLLFSLMDGVTAWLTPALLIGLFAWLRFDMREQRREVREEVRGLGKRFDDVHKRFDDVHKRFDDVHKRFDQVQRELGDLRERMARLEGALDGFLAGRRDRNVA